MKKILSILLLFLYLYESIGYFAVFQFSHEKIVSEAKKNKYFDRDIITISFQSDDNIHWIKQGKEFALNGFMYDVIKKEIRPNSILYYCVYDTKETKLLSKLSNLSDSIIINTNEKGKIYKIKLQKKISNYFPIYNNDDLLNTNKKTALSCFSIIKLSDIFISVPEPPPKQFV